MEKRGTDQFSHVKRTFPTFSVFLSEPMTPGYTGPSYTGLWRRKTAEHLLANAQERKKARLLHPASR